jgi:hypothetical protein
MPVKDIGLTDEGKLKFVNGDFQADFSDPQHQEDIINQGIGSYKQYPLTGVGVRNYQGSSGMELNLKKGIQKQLSSDGYSVNNVKFSKSGVSDFTVDAERSI